MNTLNTLPNTPCHLNGLTLPLNEAKVSVMDRGFIFGDGIYEVAPVYQGKLFRFEQHMARMARSLAELRIPNPHTEAGWRALQETAHLLATSLNEARLQQSLQQLRAETSLAGMDLFLRSRLSIQVRPVALELRGAHLFLAPSRSFLFTAR